LNSTRSTLLKVNRVNRVLLAPYRLATKLTVSATKLNVSPTESTATRCRIYIVADLSPKPATKSTASRQSTLLPICRRLWQQSTLDFVAHVYRARLFTAQTLLSISEYAKEKKTEHNFFVRSSKSEAEVTNNRRQRSTYCTIETNY